jgi:hypothetical protein
MSWTAASESPDQFHFWTAVATVAGALRSCVWIDEMHYTYTPNFFLFFVGPPGIAAKSTSIGLGMRLLEQVPDIHFGPNSLTWQYLLRKMKDSIITVQWIDDHGKVNIRAASPITVEASELGTFLKLGQEGFADTLIDLWDGKFSKRGLTHGTVGSGEITVENPWLHVIGATTPAWLARNFPEDMVYGGLTSRILFIYGDQKRQLVAYPSSYIQPRTHALTENKLIDDLTEISKLRGPFTFTPEARQWGVDWYQKLWTNSAPTALASSRYEGYKARKQALLHKIAMVVSAATREDRVLTDTILIEADQHLRSTERSMQHVFQSIGSTHESKWVHELTSIVRAYVPSVYPAMTSDQLYKLVANTMSLRDFETAIVAAVKSGSLKRIQFNSPTGLTYGVTP